MQEHAHGKNGQRIAVRAPSAAQPGPLQGVSAPQRAHEERSPHPIQSVGNKKNRPLSIQRDRRATEGRIAHTMHHPQLTHDHDPSLASTQLQPQCHRLDHRLFALACRLRLAKAPCSSRTTTAACMDAGSSTPPDSLPLLHSCVVMPPNQTSGLHCAPFGYRLVPPRQQPFPAAVCTPNL